MSDTAQDNNQNPQPNNTTQAVDSIAPNTATQETKPNPAPSVSQEEYEKMKSEYAATLDVVNFILDNEDLKTAFTEKWAAKNAPKAPTQPTAPKDGEVDEVGNKINNLEKKIESVDTRERNSKINNFELRFGLDKMKEEDRKAIQSKMAQKIADFGYTNQEGKIDLNRIPIERVETIFEDALRLVSPETVKKVEQSAASGYTNSVGAFGGGSSININTGEVTEFSPEQLKLMGSFGIDPAKAKETLNNNPQPDWE